VECIRQGNRGTRRAGTVFGGQPVKGATVTWVLVALNVLLWIVEFGYPRLADDWAIYGYGVAQGQWYRVLTCAFLPPPGFSGLAPLDIIFNMWALFLVGPALERLLGHVRFLAVYLLSAIGGSVLFIFIVAPDQPALGASGAIFGLFGAWFVVARRLHLNSRWIVTVVVANLVLDFIVPGIAWQAHIGGLVAGALLTAAYAYAPRQNRALVQVAATAGLVVLLIAGIAIRDMQLVGSVRL
jgi:membrane associated rhomboid family serine protease